MKSRTGPMAHRPARPPVPGDEPRQQQMSGFGTGRATALVGGPGEEAFHAYVLPEREMLLRQARSLTGNAADADDLVQETLLRAYRAIERFDGRYPRAWLMTIMRNAQANRVRREHQRPETLGEAEGVLGRLAAPADDGPEAVVLARRFDAAVAGALEDLPHRFRRVVELIDLNGLSYQDAATIVGAPVGTVMSRLHRARTRMRHHLEAAGLGPREGREHAA